MSDGHRAGPAIRLTTGLNAHTISLAADGSRLAFASLETESNAFVIPLPANPPVSASEETQLTFGVQFVETADMSSDGRWLVYDSDLGGNSDLYRVALPSGTPERLTTDSSDDFFPDISPDGREVAFHSWRGGSRDIYVLPLDGGPIQQVSSTSGQEAMAAWSPDGTQLAFAEFGSRGSIWTAKRENGVWQKPVLRLNRGLWPRWSPDGKFLSFSSNLISGSIWVMPADSGPPRLVVDSTGPRGVLTDQPLWSPDGRSILTRTANQNGDPTIVRVPLNGEPPRLLMTFDGVASRPSRGGWGIQSNRLVYTAPAQHSDVWVMEVQKP